MFTIALIAQKGGTGKTTLAVHLAADFEGAGGSAAIVDLDPQASAALWGDNRGRSPFVGAVPAARLEAALGAAQRSGAGLAVIDTAPHSESTALAAARAADLALTPLRPGLFDIAALDATACLCALASVPFAVVLNHVPPRGRTADLAEAAVEDYGASVAPTRIGARIAFAHCLPLGLSAAEAFPRSKAADETRALGAWLRHQLEERNAQD